MTPRRLAVKALMHQEQAGYANLVLDAELKSVRRPWMAATPPLLRVFSIQHWNAYRCWITS